MAWHFDDSSGEMLIAVGDDRDACALALLELLTGSDVD